MFDTQIILAIVIVILTLLLTVIGAQVFLILREFQKTIQKMNKMLDDAGTVSGSFAKVLGGVGESLSAISGLAGILGIFKRKSFQKEKTGEK